MLAGIFRVCLRGALGKSEHLLLGSGYMELDADMRKKKGCQMKLTMLKELFECSFALGLKVERGCNGLGFEKCRILKNKQQHKYKQKECLDRQLKASAPQLLWFYPSSQEARIS